MSRLTWEIERRRGGVDALHHLAVDGDHRAVYVFEPDRPGLALGSTQSLASVDSALVESGAREITRRHSGGGLVLLDPGDIAWIDVVLPASDPLWRVDVGEAFVWLGRVWAEAVAGAGASTDPPPVVHRGAGRHADLGRAVCFAGVGSGEVLVGDRKLVGMSQRRTRGWARFQCIVHRRFDAEGSVAALAPHLREGAFGDRLRERLGSAVATVRDPSAVVTGFIDAIAKR